MKSLSRSRSRSRKFRPIPPLRRGELRKFGYSIKLPQDERRVALQRAVNAYPVVSVMRKLNALYVLQKNRYPQNANKFKADEKWLKSNFYEPASSPAPAMKLKRVSGRKSCWRPGAVCKYVKAAKSKSKSNSKKLRKVKSKSKKSRKTSKVAKRLRSKSRSALRFKTIM